MPFDLTLLLLRVVFFMQSLTDICIENAGELLKSNFGKEIIYEVFNLFSASYISIND